MIDAKPLRPQVVALEADLRPTGASDPALKREWQKARNAGRIAADFNTWLEDRVTQAAVAWVLATVFIRFCEDHDLIEYPFIAGPGERIAQARERQQAFFEAHPEKDDYDWVLAAIDALSVSPVAKGLFEEHNPMRTIKPSPYAIKALLDFWRQTNSNGEILYDFTPANWDTRFLGDLYQELSESARKTYALLQTPEFVEDFILKYTLDPAIEEFGLEPDPPSVHPDIARGFRAIDPACGSGHFLLGAFHRLLRAWEAKEPGTDRWVLIKNAMESVHGVDKNPFAAAIARFRLLIAAMKEAGVKRLDEKVDFPLNVAVGDSLLHGHESKGTQNEFDFGDGVSGHTFRTEDIGKYIKSAKMLAFGSYHAVFANPPYIRVDDEAESDLYREFYVSCYRQYSLAVPFAERIFKLAVRGSLDGSGAGYTGQITANSFMKREFGKKLIQEFFPQIDLTHVIDSSGAYLPGFGTPTVIIFGRWRYARHNSTVRRVLGTQDEPSQPPDPAQGQVWRAIVEQIEVPGSETQWASADDLSQDRLGKHPWSFGGGGASELLDRLNSNSWMLGGLAEDIGYIGQTNADDAFFADASGLARKKVEPSVVRQVAIGELVRDFMIGDIGSAIFPYVSVNADLDSDSNAFKWLWPNRTVLGNRATFSKLTYFAEGRPWFEWHQVAHGRLNDVRSLTYAFVATHNHFIFDRSGQVGNRSAPVIKLPEGSTEDQYFSLLGVLNSSAACFWLKQVSQGKGGSGIGRGVQDEPWENRYEFTATKLEKFPLPWSLPLDLGKGLDLLAGRLANVSPASVCRNELPTRRRLDAARREYELVRGRMIAAQEELDWDVYRRYGLLTEAEAKEVTRDPETVPDLKLGERAFEIVLARRMRDEEFQTQWFDRHHGSAPTPEIPADWPDEYKAVVQRRIELIESNRNIGLIERPEYKRRWLTEPWDDKERKALREWLLGRCEERSLWFGPDGQPRPNTVNHLADLLRDADDGTDVVEVARLYAGDQDAELAKVLTKIIDTEHVPYLAQLRYKGEGLVKRAVWERTWQRQREEDASGVNLGIAVPPKYKNADFQKPSYWRNRGKLDVPKERFISYPKANPDTDKSLLLGWAGWDYLEQAQALQGLIDERETTDGWTGDKVRWLVEGLIEVMPWVRQWHNEVDPAVGQSWADAYDAYLAEKRIKYGIPE